MPDRLMLLDSASPGAATDGGRLDVNLAAFGVHPPVAVSGLAS